MTIGSLTVNKPFLTVIILCFLLINGYIGKEKALKEISLNFADSFLFKDDLCSEPDGNIYKLVQVAKDFYKLQEDYVKALETRTS